MAEDQTPAAVPAVVEWTLRNARSHETRTFEQAELSIEGEARLVGLARKLAAVLAQIGYTFEQLGAVLNDEEATDWKFLFDVLTDVAVYAPDLIADLGTMLLGIYPTDETGAPTPTFEADRIFLRGALNSRVLVEMARVFTQQNDYRRLMTPFGMTLSGAMAAFRGQPASVVEGASEEPSFGGRIVGTDGSLIELQTANDQTNPTTGPALSAIETPSESSLA